MKKPALLTTSSDDYSALNTEALLSLLAEKDTQLAATKNQLDHTKSQVKEQKCYIHILEEYLRLANIKRFGTSSEKLDCQVDLFDEAEREVALAELEEPLPEEELPAPREKKTRCRGFSRGITKSGVSVG